MRRFIGETNKQAKLSRIIFDLERVMEGFPNAKIAFRFDVSLLKVAELCMKNSDGKMNLRFGFELKLCSCDWK